MRTTLNDKASWEGIKRMWEQLSSSLTLEKVQRHLVSSFFTEESRTSPWCTRHIPTFGLDISFLLFSCARKDKTKFLQDLSIMIQVEPQNTQRPEQNQQNTWKSHLEKPSNKRWEHKLAESSWNWVTFRNSFPVQNTTYLFELMGVCRKTTTSFHIMTCKGNLELFPFWGTRTFSSECQKEMARTTSRSFNFSTWNLAFFFSRILNLSNVHLLRGNQTKTRHFRFCASRVLTKTDQMRFYSVRQNAFGPAAALPLPQKSLSWKPQKIRFLSRVPFFLSSPSISPWVPVLQTAVPVIR